MSPSKDPLRAHAPEVTASWPQVCGWRLQRQHVTARAADPLAAAAALGGVQAQVTSAAEYTLGIRSPATRDGLAAALWTDRTLVKTWAMRGTLHWLPAAEYPLWIAALKTREWRITPGWETYHGVTAAELAAITEAIPEALSGTQLTRDELAQRLAEVTGNGDLGAQLRSGWGAVLKPAANRGLLCFGPDRGRNVTFVDPTDWLGTIGPEPAPAEGLRQVLHRFLDAYGPATHKDHARWFGIPEKPARELFAEHAAELVVTEVDGHRGWVTPGGAETLAGATPAAGLVMLGGFDPYVLAPLSHRAVIIPEGHIDEVSRTAGWISAVMLIDGFVAGTWSTEASARGTTVEVRPFAKLTAEQTTAVRDWAAGEATDLLTDPVEVRVLDP